MVRIFLSNLNVVSLILLFLVVGTRVRDISCGPRFQGRRFSDEWNQELGSESKMKNPPLPSWHWGTYIGKLVIYKWPLGGVGFYMTLLLATIWASFVGGLADIPHELPPTLVVMHHMEWYEIINGITTLMSFRENWWSPHIRHRHYHGTPHSPQLPYHP